MSPHTGPNTIIPVTQPNNITNNYKQLVHSGLITTRRRVAPMTNMICDPRCLGGAAVRRRTRDRKVAGSTPGRGAIKSTRSTLSLPSLRVGKSSTSLPAAWLWLGGARSLVSGGR